jgi:hypothetical protein
MASVALLPQQPAPSRAAGRPRARVAILLILHAVVALLSTRPQSLTYDEYGHYLYGEQILSLNSDRFENSKMPFSAMNALVVRLARAVAPDAMAAAWQPERVGRIATILFSVAIGYVLYRWAAEAYGAASGLAALFLYALEPNILAHAGLMTTDIFIAGMSALSVYAFWGFLRRPSLRSALLASLLLGLSQIAKYSGVLLYPLLVLLAIGYAVGRRRHAWSPRQAARWAGYALLFLVISLAVINLGFLFNRTFTPLGEFTFRSDLFLGIQSRLSFARGVPVPLPYPYVEGLDLTVRADQTGESYGSVYLLGQTRKPDGFAGYFLVASLFKVPLASQIAFAVALGVFLIRRRGEGFWEREWFLLGPALFFTIYFNFLVQAQIGIRLFLVAFPFFIVFTSGLFRGAPSWGRPARLLAGAGALYLAISVASYFPNYIPYFNELIGNRLHAYRILSDSNIDYGQAEGFLADYLAAHPGALVEPRDLQPGTLVISVDRLTGVREAPAWVARLRDTLEPVDHVAYAYLVYQVTAQDLAGLSP